MNRNSIAASQLSRRSFVRTLALAAVAGATPLRAGPKHAADLPEIIRRNTLARGGAAALDEVRSLAVDVEIVEGGQKLSGRYAATDKGLVRVDVYAEGKLVASEGVDEAGVWILGRDGPEPSVATGAANALLHGAENHLFGWHRFVERGHRLKLMPPLVLDGLSHPVVEVRYSTGHVSYFIVDPISWQAVRRRDERAYHPDVDQTQKRVETRFGDFTTVGGVVAAHRSEDHDLSTGKLLAENRVLSRRLNPELAADHFDRNRRAAASL